MPGLFVTGARTTTLNAVATYKGKVGKGMHHNGRKVSRIHAHAVESGGDEWHVAVDLFHDGEAVGHWKFPAHGRKDAIKKAKHVVNVWGRDAA